MLCEQCKVKPAEIHLVNVVNGERHVQHLCRECAISALHLGDAASLMKMSFSVEGLADIEEALRELLLPINPEAHPRPARGRHYVCPHCGAELPDSMFEEGNAADEGEPQAPEAEKAPHIISTEEEISLLKKRMALAVKNENYEYAAQLRDRITELEKDDAAQDSDKE